MLFCPYKTIDLLFVEVMLIEPGRLLQHKRLRLDPNIACTIDMIEFIGRSINFFGASTFSCDAWNHCCDGWQQRETFSLCPWWVATTWVMHFHPLFLCYVLPLIPKAWLSFSFYVSPLCFLWQEDKAKLIPNFFFLRVSTPYARPFLVLAGYP